MIKLAQKLLGWSKEKAVYAGKKALIILVAIRDALRPLVTQKTVTTLATLAMLFIAWKGLCYQLPCQLICLGSNPMCDNNFQVKNGELTACYFNKDSLRGQHQIYQDLVLELFQDHEKLLSLIRAVNQEAFAAMQLSNFSNSIRALLVYQIYRELSNNESLFLDVDSIECGFNITLQIPLDQLRIQFAPSIEKTHSFELISTPLPYDITGLTRSYTYSILSESKQFIMKTFAEADTNQCSVRVFDYKQIFDGLSREIESAKMRSVLHQTLSRNSLIPVITEREHLGKSRKYWLTIQHDEETTLTKRVNLKFIAEDGHGPDWKKLSKAYSILKIGLNLQHRIMKNSHRFIFYFSPSHGPNEIAFVANEFNAICKELLPGCKIAWQGRTDTYLSSYYIESTDSNGFDIGLTSIWTTHFKESLTSNFPSLEFFEMFNENSLTIIRVDHRKSTQR